jgi:plastocyanin
MRTFVLSLVAAFALGGVALAQSSPAPSPAASPVPNASPAATVHIKNFAFSSDTVTITAGQSVRFVEDDETPHTVTADDKSFDSGNLNKGAKWDHVFTTAGTYTYLCAYHPYMKGKIVVK